ncbi:helix-turn-helix domain-containing protein [Microbacterium sp.]|uniref:helix-turn-helix domain-containing protein n=1 Tax=Microbacterium sp. TaxID=51671 RepID=UPI0039E61159
MAIAPEAREEWAAFARELGHRLRRARDEAGLTQEQLVELAGISLYAYQQYERGAATRRGAPTNPRLATILAIAQVLDVRLEELLPAAPKLTTR